MARKKTATTKQKTTVTLQAPDQVEVSPVPRNGRPHIGRSVVHWVNEMGEWPIDDVTRASIEGDTVAQQIAARWILRAHSNMTTSAGQPVGERSLADLLDRTLGKASQQIEVTHNETKTLHVISLTTEHLRRIQDATK